MFEILSIQADNGDSLFVSYGAEDRPRHLLIDGGTTDVIHNLIKTLTLQRSGERLRLEALVVTHYDLDHIQGIIELLRDPPEWLDIADVWFNGRHHLFPCDALGHEEGTELSELIKVHYPWNEAFGGNVIKSGERVELPDGMIVSVVSPGEPEIAKLSVAWPAQKDPTQEDDTEAASDLLGRQDTWPPGAFTDALREKLSKDTSVANGSSIALVLDFEGKRALLTGDAFSSVVASGIKSFWTTGRVPIDLLKLSHHGSKRNTDQKLLETVECSKFLFSTNSRTHGHPDNALVARVLNNSEEPLLIFNYKIGRPLLWETVPCGWPSYQTLFPEGEEPFVRIKL
ncbi:hypothetical protein KBX73_12860 [Acetobacter persici]|uniref:ComEC/Rec2 family competence protein n=1 Tax=Acetobacter persici TaxID=1076596 RepID=UPI0020CD71CC|nr:hypothetical protein [Acetobacter persici]MCP9320645.1 hypothetical protein [Acetobacter persici]